MADPVVQPIMQAIQGLKPSQQLELRLLMTAWLTEVEAWSQQPATIQHVREARFADGLKCPRCRSDRVKRNGNFRDKKGFFEQRYLCHACRRTFSDLTKTPLAEAAA